MESVQAQPIARSARLGIVARVLIVLAGAAIALWLIDACLFTVDVTEYGAVMRFGRVVRIVSEPGLQLKAPFDAVNRVDKRLVFSRPSSSGIWKCLAVFI